MASDMLLDAERLLQANTTVVVDCRFSLADSGEGLKLYQQGHIPGAHYLDLNRDLSGPPGEHGGRHPLPDSETFAARLASLGIGPDSDVVAYDDSRLAFASRLWWLMRSLGYKPPRLLDGGYNAFLEAGGEPETVVPTAQPADSLAGAAFSGCCDIEGLRAEQAAMALVIDSREETRYQGREEPIDPVAGHIPGAINRPWQGVTTPEGRVLDAAGQREHWGDALDTPHLVVYCGSGVTACVNLFSLALLGRDDATLYAGSWSDWCSHL